jgi:hypothetical protein
MNVKCRICGEFFCPSEDSLDLIIEGIISSESMNICDDCHDLMELTEHDLSESFSDAGP